MNKFKKKKENWLSIKYHLNNIGLDSNVSFSLSKALIPTTIIGQSIIH